MDLAAYQASFDKLWGYTNIVRLGVEHLTEKGAIVLVSGAPARRAKPGQAALASVGEAARKENKAFVSFVSSPEKAREWSQDFGITMFFISSEHNWLRDPANAVADKVHKI